MFVGVPVSPCKFVFAPFASCLLSISQLLFQACLPFDAYLVVSPFCEVLTVFNSTLVSEDDIFETVDIAILCATCHSG